MSCCHECVPQEFRPGTARVLLTELSESGQTNPNPAKKPYGDSETPMDLFLFPEKLKLLCGTQDLSHVTSVELCIDTQENTLGNFGVYLPKLVQLKLNNSRIMSARDLGTTLSHLQVLWMTRCCLQDLDGISTLSALKELYVAYNNLSDLSHICMLESLQVLDLEGNDVDDLVQVQYLGLCSKLQALTLEGNPVCVRPNPTVTQTADYSYRASVRELVPQLRYLDNVRVEEDRCYRSGGDSRQCISSQQTQLSQTPWFQPLLCLAPLICRLQTSHWLQIHVTNWAWSSLLSGWRPSSAVSNLAAVTAETSILTHGAGKNLFCGNPIQAVRARRKELRTAPSRSTFTPCHLPIYIPEHTYDLEEPDVRERGDVFAELRAWREQHSRRLKAIEVERIPQVLAIQHMHKEEEEDDTEEGFSAMREDSSEEEHEVEEGGDNLETDLLVSSFQSLSPDLHQHNALFPDMTTRPLFSETTVSPSPPLGATAGSGHNKPQGIRARRLRFSQGSPKHLKDASRVECFVGTGTTAGEAELAIQRVQQVQRPDVPLLLQAGYIPHLPPTTYDRLTYPCMDMNVSTIRSGNKHKVSKLRDRPVITRPHTARAALQKHHILQSCRGSSQSD
ncbi:hypothetical protein Q5P01_012259 [Channa striata]|uniref:Leucine-rich repeat-containing protein 56 n=1 Tax=Channa striata TaxID=64152 RepID=A0AA88MRE6_CHASR|nr:hypothetical protein Q5P01_012259 [Channa striata]